MPETMADAVLTVTIINTLNHTASHSHFYRSENPSTTSQRWKASQKSEPKPVSILRWSHKVALADLGLIYVEQAGLELAGVKGVH